LDKIASHVEEIEKKFKQLVNDFLDIQFEICELRLMIKENETK